MTILIYTQTSFINIDLIIIPLDKLLWSYNLDVEILSYNLKNPKNLNINNFTLYNFTQKIQNKYLCMHVWNQKWSIVLLKSEKSVC